MLQIPCETFGTKVRCVLDGVADALLGLHRQALGVPAWGRPLWETRESEALSHALNSPWTGGSRATLLLDLRCAPGVMALAERRNLLFGADVKPIVGLLRTTWLILQSLVERCQCSVAELVEITATDPKLRRDLGEWGSTEEVEDGCDPLRNFRGWESRDGVHGSFLLVVDHGR